MRIGRNAKICVNHNGEELFYLKDSGATVCSLRVKKLLISNTISNVSFEDLDIECRLYKSKTTSYKASCKYLV